MRRVAVLGVAFAALLVPATGSFAKTACNLVSDKANDSGLFVPAGPVRTPAHDITSVDVATGKKTLVVVMRLTTTALAGDPAASGGITWDVKFTIGGVGHQFTRKIAQNGTITDTALQNNAAIAGLVVKMDGKTVTFTVPRNNVPKLKAKNAVLTGFFASTQSGAPGASYDYAPDNARGSSATYIDRQASCVRPA